MRQVGGNVKCDSSSIVAGDTCLITRASGTALDGDVRFPDKFSITPGAFALGEVLNFGSLACITDCYGELLPLHGAAPVGNEPPASPPPLESSRADLEVLVY